MRTTTIFAALTAFCLIPAASAQLWNPIATKPKPNMIVEMEPPVFIYDQSMHGAQTLSVPTYSIFGFGGRNDSDQFLAPCEAGVTGLAIDFSGHQYYSYWHGQTGTGVCYCTGGFNDSSRTRLTGPLKQAMGVAVDAKGRIYVVDAQLNSVFRFDDIAGHGLVQFGSTGSGVGQFLRPSCIALDRHERVFVGDTGNNRICSFTDMSTAGWQTYDGNAHGNAGAPVPSPRFIAVDDRSRIYYLRPEAGKVVRVDDMAGHNMVSYGSPAQRQTTLNTPGGLALDPFDRIYISDPEGQRVVRIDDMSGAGRAELTWNRGAESLRRPTLLCVGKREAAAAPRIR